MRAAMKLVAVLTLAVVDGVLLMLVLRADAADGADPVDVGSSEGAPSAVLAPTGHVSLTISGGNLLLRVQQGSCTGTGRPVLEVSRDLGGSFREVALPVVDGRVVPVVLSAASKTVNELSIVAADADCRPQGFATTDGGQDWKAIDVPDGAWFVGADRTSVVSPARESDSGCDIASFSTFTAINARLLCTSGEVRGTNDAGATWVSLGALDEARAASFFGLRGGYAVAPAEGCASQVYVTGDAGGSWTAVGCIDEKAVVRQLVGKEARLIASDGTTSWIGTEGGSTWKKAEPVEVDDEDED